MYVCVFADGSELMYVECVIAILVVSFPTYPISLFLLPFYFYPYFLFPDVALSFEFSSYTVDESQTILPVLIVKEPRGIITESEYQFSIMATDATATAPDDYMVPQAHNFTLVPGRQQLQYTVEIIDDPFAERIEIFRLELFVVEQPYFLLGSITRVTVTIIDDDEREDEGREGRERGTSRRGGRERGREEESRRG